MYVCGCIFFNNYNYILLIVWSFRILMYCFSDPDVVKYQEAFVILVFIYLPSIYPNLHLWKRCNENYDH